MPSNAFKPFAALTRTLSIATSGCLVRDCPHHGNNFMRLWPSQSANHTSGRLRQLSALDGYQFLEHEAYVFLHLSRSRLFRLSHFTLKQETGA